jgi:hypothetical protein
MANSPEPSTPRNQQNDESGKITDEWARRSWPIGRESLLRHPRLRPGSPSGVGVRASLRAIAEPWTGAEIKSCCRLASLLDVPLVQAAQNIVPVAVTAGDKIEALRQWASGRCLSADRAGVYSRSKGSSGGRVRRVVRAE